MGDDGSNLLIPMGGGHCIMGTNVRAQLDGLLDAEIAKLPEPDRTHCNEHREELFAELTRAVMESGTIPESISLFKK